MNAAIVSPDIEQIKREAVIRAYDLDVRAKNVKDNLAMIKQAAELEIERIETIQRTMREMNLPFAGQALIYLND